MPDERVDKIGKEMIYSPKHDRQLYITKEVVDQKMKVSVYGDITDTTVPTPPEPLGPDGEIKEGELFLETKDGARYEIRWIDEGTLIQTSGRIDDQGKRGPGCTWYWWGGRWWLICDGS